MRYSPLEQFDVIPVLLWINTSDRSFTNIILPLIVILLLSLFIISMWRKNTLFVPPLIQYIIENLTVFIFSIIKQQIGIKGYRFFPLLFTIFNFILLSNYISLLPMGIALTSHIIVTLFLSSSLCLSIFIFGLMHKRLKFLKLFVPSCPLALLPMLILIELFSYSLRSFSLAIRLSANILAGHTLVHIITILVFSLMSVKLIYFFFWIFGFVTCINIRSCNSFFTSLCLLYFSMFVYSWGFWRALGGL